MGLILDWIGNLKDELSHARELQLAEKTIQVSQWINRIACGEERLGEWIGKAAIDVCWHDPLEDYHQIGVIFKLGLKYYLARDSRELQVMDEIDLLTNTDFHNMRTWSGHNQGSVMQNNNIAAAFIILNQWERAIV